MEIKKTACEYVNAGLSVVILLPATKLPSNKNWASLAKYKIEDLNNEFRTSSSANIGIRLGRASQFGEYYLYAIDLSIFDINSAEKAYNELSNIFKDYAKLPCARTHNTNSRHFYFLSKRILKGGIISSKEGGWKIELMSNENYLMAPPSKFGGLTYSWERPLLNYLLSDSLKASMIAELNIKNEDVERLNSNWFAIEDTKKALLSLDNSWLDSPEKWAKIGKALHTEYAGTQDEDAAIILFETWSQKSPFFASGDGLKKWKQFDKKETSENLGELLFGARSGQKSTMERFADKLESIPLLSPAKLKDIIKETGISQLELSLFENDICNALSLGFNRKLSPTNARKFIAEAYKQNNDEHQFKMEIGLDDTLARMVIKNKYADGNHIMHVNGNIFIYNKGVWSLTEMAVVAQSVYNAISDIIRSEDEQYRLVQETLQRKRKTDDLNNLTNNILQTILKITTSSVMEDKLNLRQKKKRTYSVINTLNKEIYIENGEISIEEHSFDSYLGTQMNVMYDPAADCPHFKQALNNVFQEAKDKDDIIRHFQECWGQVFQSKKDLEMFMLFLGSGDNGKTFITKCLTQLIPDYVLSVPINQFTKDAHATASLLNKLLVLDDDFKSGELLDDGFLKKTSSEATVSANPKFKEIFNFNSIATSVICANFAPRTTDTSNGMTRRVQVFNFDHKFTESERDLTLKDKIALEGSGILNWIIEGYVRLQKRGRFIVPVSCEMSKNRWTRSSNTLHLFIDEFLIVTGDNNDKVKSQSVYTAYKNFCNNENGSYPLSMNAFYDQLCGTTNKITQGFDASLKQKILAGIKLKINQGDKNPWA